MTKLSKCGLTDAELVAYVWKGMLFDNPIGAPPPIEYDIADRLEELSSHTCDTCDNQQVESDDPKNPWCDYLTTLANNFPRIYCYDVGQTCGAWKSKLNHTIKKET